MKTPKKTLIVVSTFIALTSSPLFATESYVEEIVVTAQKRAQALSDVPISATAFTGAAIEESGINDAKSLVLFTPGLSGATKDSYVDAISVRGISTNDFGVGGDPSIAIFKNGVYSGRTGEVEPRFRPLG